MRITFDHDHLAELLEHDEEFAEIDGQLRSLDLTNREHTRDKGLDLTYDLMNAAGTADLRWQLDGADSNHLDVYANFPGAPDGAVDIEYIEFQAYLTLGSGICSVGTNSIIDLLPADRDEASAEAILTGISMKLTGIANSLASLFAATTPEPSIEQRVVPIDGIRAEADDNPNLTKTERAALINATDTQIADALAANWRPIEDQFFAVHDELQAAAVSTLTAAANAQHEEMGASTAG
ncbi:MAG: hypothetical protein L0H59_11330 [Tomitella sp.]|nr:hypothetical protein [Tomitella sp.]